MLCGLFNFLFNQTHTKREEESGRKEYRGIIEEVSELALDQSYSNFEEDDSEEVFENNEKKRINSYLVKTMDGFEFELNCSLDEYEEIKDILSPRKLVQVIYFWPEELEYPYATEVHPLIQNDFEIMTWREVLDSHDFEYDTPIKVSKNGPLRLEFLKDPQTYIVA